MHQSHAVRSTSPEPSGLRLSPVFPGGAGCPTPVCYLGPTPGGGGAAEPLFGPRRWPETTRSRLSGSSPQRLDVDTLARQSQSGRRDLVSSVDGRQLGHGAKATNGSAARTSCGGCGSFDGKRHHGSAGCGPSALPGGDDRSAGFHRRQLSGWQPRPGLAFRDDFYHLRDIRMMTVRLSPGHVCGQWHRPGELSTPVTAAGW